MEGKYRIGRYEFDSREEWENALKDLRKIKSIVDHIDIDDPEQVLGVYKVIREGRITFASELGAAFFCDLSDRVIEHSQDIDTKERKKTQSGKSLVFKGIGIACMVLAILCFSIYSYFEYRERKATQELERVQNEKNISQAINWYFERLRTKDAENAQADGETVEAVNAETAEEIDIQPEVLQEYAGLYAQYPELIGWLYIEDSQIDLPVMQTTDNEYYLNRNMDGNEDVNGTLFLDCRDDIQKPSKNLIIYGHNMKSGAMFGSLKKYLDESYVNGHSRIRFDTIYEKQEFEIIAVCLSEVGYQDDGTSKYYDFIDTENSKDLQLFLEQVRGCAVYDKTQDVRESDIFLTLSTCNSYVEDGRLFIVARKIQ